MSLRLNRRHVRVSTTGSDAQEGYSESDGTRSASYTSYSSYSSGAASSSASSDAAVEALAYRALAGKYAGLPQQYETIEMLRGHLMTRRPPEHMPLSAGGLWPQRRPAGRRGVRVSSTATSLRSAQEAEEAALQRMYRRLSRLQVGKRPAPGTALSSSCASDGEVAPVEQQTKPAAPRRKPDKNAQERLLTLNVTTKAKQQEKYWKVKEREMEERKRPKRIRMSEAAMLTGKRLFQSYVSTQNGIKAMREEQKEREEKAEKEQCTFHPTISSFAEQMAFERGYQSLASRYADPRQLEAKQRRRLEFEAAKQTECTFQPVISRRTQKLMEERCQRRSASRSQRSRSSSRARCHEPFEPGERLYREGGERLLRQQIRRRRAEAKEEVMVVGSGVVLSQEAAQDLVHRFDAWRKKKERNIGDLRRTLTMQERRRESSKNLGSTAVSLGRTDPSPALTATPLSQSIPSVPLKATGTADVRRASTGSSRRASTIEATVPPSSIPASVRETSPPKLTSLDAFGFVSPLTPLALPSAFTPLSDSQKKQRRLIRFGAIFFKYAIPPHASAVPLEAVREHARLCYPEDAGLVAALSTIFSDDRLPLTKQDFVAALASFEDNHGPQPWGSLEPPTITPPEYRPAASNPASAKPENLSEDRLSSGDALKELRLASVTLQRQQRRLRTHIYGHADSTASTTPPPSSAKKPPKSGASPPPVTATEKVPGYAAHLRRYRLSRKTGRGVAEKVKSELGDGERCTFRPQLNSRSITLSALDKERRLNYARELQLRRQELKVRKECLVEVVEAAAGAPARGSEERPPAITTPRRWREGRLCSPHSTDVSPSIEVSSLSSRSPLPKTSSLPPRHASSREHEQQPLGPCFLVETTTEASAGDQRLSVATSATELFSAVASSKVAEGKMSLPPSIPKEGRMRADSLE